MGLSREFLKGLELEKSTIDAIMAEHGQSMNDLKAKIEVLSADAEKQKADYEAQLKTLQEETTQKYVELENANKDLSAKNAELGEQNKNTVKELKREYAIKSAIMKSRPIDDVSYKAHLDMSKIEYDEENDKLVGFEEQDKNIRENYSFLFNTEEPSSGEEMGNIKSTSNGSSLSILDAVNQL